MMEHFFSKTMPDIIKQYMYSENHTIERNYGILPCQIDKEDIKKV
jgi:hypothetical protein